MFPFRASFIAAIGWFCEPISTRHGFDWQPSLSHPNQIRAAVWTCTVVLVLLVFGCLWYVWVVWFLVVGLFLVLGGLWCGLFGCCVSCVGLFVIYGHSLWCFFVLVLGVEGCWLFVGLPRFLWQFSSAPRGSSWRCLQWVLGVWIVWFSHNSTGHVLVYRLPFRIVCTLGLGICFCIWLWHRAFWFWLWIWCLLRFVWGFSDILVSFPGSTCFSIK